MNLNKIRKELNIILKKLHPYIIGGVVGYFVTFAFEGCHKIGPSLSSLNDLSKSIDKKVTEINHDIIGLADSVKSYNNRTTNLINTSVHHSEDGLECLVGINNKLNDHVVSMTPEYSNGLKNYDRIRLIHQSDNGPNKYEIDVVVIIVPTSPYSDAHFL